MKHFLRSVEVRGSMRGLFTGHLKVGINGSATYIIGQMIAKVLDYNRVYMTILTNQQLRLPNYSQDTWTESKFNVKPLKNNLL